MNLPRRDTTPNFLLDNDGPTSIEGAPADDEIDWLNAPFTFDDGQQALFWVEWAHHLDGLGQ